MPADMCFKRLIPNCRPSIALQVPAVAPAGAPGIGTGLSAEAPGIIGDEQTLIHVGCLTLLQVSRLPSGAMPSMPAGEVAGAPTLAKGKQVRTHTAN